MKHSTSPTSSDNTPKTLVDPETGSVYFVIKRDTRDGLETVVAASADLPKLVYPDTNTGIQRFKAQPKFFCGRQGMTNLMVNGKLTSSEWKVLGFLIANMPWGNRIQVSQRIIADGVGLAQSHVSRALKSLKDKMVIIEDVNKLIPSVPVYLIDPTVAFNGGEMACEFERKRYGKKLSQAHPVGGSNVVPIRLRKTKQIGGVPQ